MNTPVCHVSQHCTFLLLLCKNFPTQMISYLLFSKATFTMPLSNRDTVKRENYWALYPVPKYIMSSVVQIQWSYEFQQFGKLLIDRATNTKSLYVEFFFFYNDAQFTRWIIGYITMTDSRLYTVVHQMSSKEMSSLKQALLQ